MVIEEQLSRQKTAIFYYEARKIEEGQSVNSVYYLQRSIECPIPHPVIIIRLHESGLFPQRQVGFVSLMPGYWIQCFR